MTKTKTRRQIQNEFDATFMSCPASPYMQISKISEMCINVHSSIQRVCVQNYTSKNKSQTLDQHKCESLKHACTQQIHCTCMLRPANPRFSRPMLKPRVRTTCNRRSTQNYGAVVRTARHAETETTEMTAPIKSTITSEATFRPTQLQK